MSVKIFLALVAGAAAVENNLTAINGTDLITAVNCCDERPLNISGKAVHSKCSTYFVNM